MKKLEFFLVISVVSVVSVVLIDYMPYKIPSIVEKPEKIESVISNLALAYIASYLFYYINIYIPEKRNSKIIRKTINNNIVFIHQKRIKLNQLKNIDINETFQIELNDKMLSIEDFLKYNNKHLHDNLDSILTIKDRLPTELLYYTILLKRHPNFRSSLIKLEKLDEYIESYDVLSNKLYIEFEKL